LSSLLISKQHYLFPKKSLCKKKHGKLVNALHNASFDTTVLFLEDLKEIGKEGTNKDDWIEESEIVRKGQLTF
jgi:hypothetical protein